MSKRKGLSADEKRKRMLDFFYEKKDFFLLKELEKYCPKEKGIVAQSVKDVLSSLVDDDLVDTDKIGTSVYFWAFPSKATQSRKRKLSEISSKLTESSKKLKYVEGKLEVSSADKEEGEERSRTLAQLQELKNQKEAMEKELTLYKDSDPESLNKMKKETEMCKEAANRWTDNVFSIQSWIGQKFPSLDVKELNKQFGIPEDFDYVE